MSPIHVATAINKNYLLPLAVLIDSLQRHLAHDAKLIVHLLHVDLEDRHLEPLSRLADINAIQVGNALLAEIPRDKCFPPEAAFPLLLADALPTDLERVLFLDADMLAFDDVSSIWTTPFDDHVVAVVRDATLPLCSSPRAVKGWRESGIPSETEYFNGGFLFINLPLWRARDVTRRACEYLKRNGSHVDFFHQEALNFVLWNQRVMIAERWNLQASSSGRSRDRSGVETWRNPGIVHFSGRMKPWRHPIGGPFQEPYQQALERVLALYPRTRPTMRETLFSYYDIYLRDWAYPIERFLWRHRWL